MKTFRLLTMAVIALLAGGFLQSCSDDDDGPGSAKDLVGIWEATHEIYWEKINGEITYESEDDYDDGESYRVKFNADKTFIAYYGTRDKESGTYTYKNGILTLTYDYGDDEWDSYNVKTLNTTTLVLEFSSKSKDNGNTYENYGKTTFRRISDDND